MRQLRLLLIEPKGRDVPVSAVVLVALLLVVGPLALVAGVDSRVDQVSRRRPGH